MGGINSKNKVLNDIWSFNTDLKKWYKCRVDFKDCPELYESGIAQHEACVVKQNPSTKRDKEDPNLGYTEGIYIFGGRNDYAEANNNLCILRTGENPMRMIRCQTKGTPPAPRFGHTMSFLPAKNHLVVFGGCGPSYVPCYGDLFTISVEKLCWSSVTTTGTLPEPRTNHSMVNDRDALIIFGGINEAGFLPSDIHVIVLVDRGNWKKYDGMGSNQVTRTYFKKKVATALSMNKNGAEDMAPMEESDFSEGSEGGDLDDLGAKAGIKPIVDPPGKTVGKRDSQKKMVKGLAGLLKGDGKGGKTLF